MHCTCIRGELQLAGLRALVSRRVQLLLELVIGPLRFTDVSLLFIRQPKLSRFKPPMESRKSTLAIRSTVGTSSRSSNTAQSAEGFPTPVLTQPFLSSGCPARRSSIRPSHNCGVASSESTWPVPMATAPMNSAFDQRASVIAMPAGRHRRGRVLPYVCIYACQHTIRTGHKPGKGED